MHPRKIVGPESQEMEKTSLIERRWTGTVSEGVNIGSETVRIIDGRSVRQRTNTRDCWLEVKDWERETEVEIFKESQRKSEIGVNEL